MEIIRLDVQNMVVNMIEDDHGDVWATNRMLCVALGMTENALRLIASKNPDKFSGNCVSTRHAIFAEFLRQHKVELGLKYIRGDMRLWSDEDAIWVAMLSSSPVAKEFSAKVIRTIKQSAVRNRLTREEHEAAIAELRQELSEQRKELTYLRGMVEAVQPALSSVASAAGLSLVAQKDLRKLRR